MNAIKPYDSLRLQIARVSDLADIGPKFSMAVSVDHLLSLIVKQSLDLMSVDVCIIWLKDDSQKLVPRIGFGLKMPLATSGRVKIGAKFVKCVMEKDHLTNINNLEEADVPLKALIRKEGLKSMLAASMALGDEKIGVLMLFTKTARNFTDIDLKLFDALSKQSALAITNIGLYDKMNKKVLEKVKEMSVLSSMSKSLSTTIDLDVILHIILEKTRLLMKAKFCTLRLLDSTRNELNLVSYAGLGKRQVKTLSKFENEMSKKMLSSGSTYIVNIETHFAGKPPACLKKENIHSFLTVPLFSNRRKSGALSVYIPEQGAFEKEHIEMLEMVANFCAMAIDNTTMLERIRKDYLNTIKTLAKIIDANDPYMHGHCDKVMKYSIKICRKLRLPGKEIIVIKTASLLHDIGKVGIDMSILRKASKLTEEDWVKIRMHPDIGAAIISQVGFLGNLVPVIRHHHERFTGGGYPEKDRCGERIPLGARIISVADAFDAMTSDRPYRKAMSKEEALQELKMCAGTQFDPKVVNAFLKAQN